VVDVSDEASVVAMFASIRAIGWAPRLLINNAGLSQKSLAVFTTGASARQILEVNLVGAFVVSREAVKAMQRQRFGRIVNLSSINVPLASAGGAIYNASKAGLESLGVSLAGECRQYDITINSIGLSLVAGTGMVESLDEKALEAKKVQLIKPKPIETAEIVAAIDYFASDTARNVTGQVLYFGGVR
jgi:3-oxoacyl-[acyl-carrier protein] reductase